MLDFLVAGGPFMVLLVLTSVVALAFIIERGFALRWRRVIPGPLSAAVETTYTTGDAEPLKQACQAHPSPLSRLLLLAAEHLAWTKPENQDALQTQARHEVLKLERGLVVLEVIVGISPLLGLVGTIHGLITLFGDIGRAGLGDSSVVARGIGIALNTTRAGLLIAVPSLVAWSYFTKKVEVLTAEMELICDEFLRFHYRRRKKA